MVRWPIIFICTCGPCNCVPTPPHPPPGGGRLLPIMAYTGGGGVPPERVTFFSLQVNEMLWISLVEVYECVGKYVISSVKRLKRTNRCILNKAVKKLRKRSSFVIYSWYVKDNAFTVVERDAKFYTWCVTGVSFINRRYTKGGTFLSKTVYKRVIKGSNLGVEPPCVPFLWHPPRRCELVTKPKERTSAWEA